MRLLKIYRVGKFVLDNRGPLIDELLAARDGALEPVTFGTHTPKLRELFQRLTFARPLR